MSVQHLEEQVRALAPPDLARFVVWLDTYLDRGRPGGYDPDAGVEDLSEPEQAELLRRRSEILASPSSVQPMDDGYFEELNLRPRSSSPQTRPSEITDQPPS